MTPEQALTQFGTLYKTTRKTATTRTVHTRETCWHLQVDHVTTREVTHPGAIPLRAEVCGTCGPGGRQARVDGGADS